MKFLYSDYLIILFLPIIILTLNFFSKKKNEKRRKKYINDHILFNVLNIKKEKEFQFYLWLIVLSLSIIALSRPVGELINQDFIYKNKNIVFAVDISNSMKANDTDDKNRFETSKKIIKQIVEKLNGEKVSLIAFSEKAFPLTPLTNDYSNFHSFLDSLNFSYGQNGSTNISDVLKVASERFTNKDLIKQDKKGFDIVFIFSDGEQQNINKLNTYKSNQSKIIINTIGIGSKEGSKIPIEGFNKNSYLTYLGIEVISKLNDQFLISISNQFNGKYYHYRKDNLVISLLSDIKKIDGSSPEKDNKLVYEELFQIYLYLIVIIIFLGDFIPKYLGNRVK